MIGDKSYTNIQVEAIRDSLDFLSCGYVFVFSWSDKSTMICRMVHKYNGNTLLIHATSSGYTISKNDKIVKSVEMKLDGFSYNILVNSDLRLSVTKYKPIVYV